MTESNLPARKQRWTDRLVRRWRGHDLRRALDELAVEPVGRLLIYGAYGERGDPRHNPVARFLALRLGWALLVLTGRDVAGAPKMEGADVVAWDRKLRVVRASMPAAVARVLAEFDAGEHPALERPVQGPSWLDEVES